jgi:hypothetical protein
MVARDGGKIVPSNKPQADGVPVKVPARAWRWIRAAARETAAVGTTSTLERLRLLLASMEYSRPLSVATDMVGASIGLLVAFVLILCGLCVGVTAAAWLPDLPPPGS